MPTNENQSWTQDELASQPVDAGQGSAYGVHNFHELAPEQKTLVLTAYTKALERGWQIPEAEDIARQALYRDRCEKLKPAEPAPQPPQDFTDDNDGVTDDQPETPRTMPTVAKFAFLLAAVLAVAYFALQAFLGPATPLQAAITARSKAAVTLADATAKANAANAALSSAKARYEAAYKREACIVAGTCIPKK